MSDHTVVLQDESLPPNTALVDIAPRRWGINLAIRDSETDKVEYRITVELHNGELRVLTWDADIDRNPQGITDKVHVLTTWPVDAVS